HPCWKNTVVIAIAYSSWHEQSPFSSSLGRTENSWGPQAIGDHGAPCPCPYSKKPMKKGTGASHGAPF
ncbi:unnamed protein product, partial [Staurois parvus]